MSIAAFKQKRLKEVLNSILIICQKYQLPTSVSKCAQDLYLRAYNHRQKINGDDHMKMIAGSVFIVLWIYDYNSDDVDVDQNKQYEINNEKMARVLNMPIDKMIDMLIKASQDVTTSWNNTKNTDNTKNIDNTK